MLLGAGPGGTWHDVLTVVFAVTENFKTLVWHVADGGGRSPALKDRLRALGQHRGLVEERPEFCATVSSLSKTTYCDVGWVAPAARRQLIQLLSRPGAEGDVVLGLFPEQRSQIAVKWGRASLGLLWLWTNRFGREQPSINEKAASSVILAWLSTTVKLGGVSVSIIPTEDAGRLLWFVEAREIDRIGQALESTTSIDWLSALDDLTRLWWLGLA